MSDPLEYTTHTTEITAAVHLQNGVKHHRLRILATIRNRKVIGSSSASVHTNPGRLSMVARLLARFRLVAGEDGLVSGVLDPSAMRIELGNMYAEKVRKFAALIRGERALHGGLGYIGGVRHWWRLED